MGDYNREYRGRAQHKGRPCDGDKVVVIQSIKHRDGKRWVLSRRVDDDGGVGVTRSMAGMDVSANMTRFNYELKRGLEELRWKSGGIGSLF
jgi:hypothetical protein